MVLLQVQAPPPAVARLLQLLRDGEFLDERSEVLRGRFVTYNHPLDSFATVEMEFTKGSNGAYHAQVLNSFHTRSCATQSAQH